MDQRRRKSNASNARSTRSQRVDSHARSSTDLSRLRSHRSAHSLANRHTIFDFELAPPNLDLDPSSQTPQEPSIGFEFADHSLMPGLRAKTSEEGVAPPSPLIEIQEEKHFEFPWGEFESYDGPREEPEHPGPEVVYEQELYSEADETGFIDTPAPSSEETRSDDTLGKHVISQKPKNSLATVFRRFSRASRRRRKD